MKKILLTLLLGLVFSGVSLGQTFRNHVYETKMYYIDSIITDQNVDTNTIYINNHYNGRTFEVTLSADSNVTVYIINTKRFINTNTVFDSLLLGGKNPSTGAAVDGSSGFVMANSSAKTRLILSSEALDKLYFKRSPRNKATANAYRVEIGITRID